MGNKVSIKNLDKDYVNEILNDKWDSQFLREMGIGQCIIYNFDSLFFGNLNEAVIDRDNMMEAKFFNDNYEISLYRDEDDFRGTIFNDKDFSERDIIHENRCIYCKKDTCQKNTSFNRMDVKKYIEYDEEGQAYVSYIKPCRFLRGDR